MRPQVDDIVRIQILKGCEMGCLVTLPDYGGCEALVLASEISNVPYRFDIMHEAPQRLRNVTHAKVLRINDEYIDLSVKRV